MANLYLTEQGSVLRKTGDRLIVEKDDQVLLDVHCHKIDTVLIFGNIQVTTPAIHELFEHGIELAMLTRRGRLIGQITSPTPKNITLRLAQYDHFRDSSFILSFSKTIVCGKIQNAISLLRRYAYSHPAYDFNLIISGLERDEKQAQEAESPKQLLGIEGTAARRYFEGYGLVLPEEAAFEGRRKRPPPDPVNALLSLGYTMVFNEISSLLDGVGFDPYLGFYHKPDYGRPSLAADLLEEFRAPLIDRLTATLFNQRMLSKEDFAPHPNKGGCFLKKEPMKRYFAEYERFITTPFKDSKTGSETDFRRCFRNQIQILAKAIQEDQVYLPFSFRR